MKKLFILLFFVSYLAAESKRIVVVAASYNNAQWYQRNLDSLFEQNYDNWHLLYTDDCSGDGTGQLVEDYVKQRGFQDRVTLTRNTQRRGALANQYEMIHSCANTDVIVILDGDDWFAHKNVLTRVNEIYQDDNVWLTYGQFREWPSGAHGFCCPMPEHVVRNNSFRKFQNIPSHLRTFYAGLFKKIEKEDLMLDGKFFAMTGDIAAMFPMIEMARVGHFKFVPEVLLTYNGANNLNDHKVSKALQRKIDLLLRAKKPYSAIESPF